MRKFRFFLVFFIFLLISALTFSQKNILKTTPLLFAKSASPEPFVFSTVNSLKIKNDVIMPFGTGIHYTAFFCRMELKAVNHYNIWLKFHAGDYDKYAFKNYSQ